MQKKQQWNSSYKRGTFWSILSRAVFPFSTAQGSSFPVWFQDELHGLLTLLSLAVIRALLCLSWEPSLRFAAFCFIYHQDRYYCKLSEATAALRASPGLLLVLSTPNEQHLESHTQSAFSQQLQNPDQCRRAHTPALQASLWLSST